MSVSASLDCGHSALAGLGELRASKSNAASLSSQESLTGAGRYQGALFLGKGGKQVQNERINVRAQLGNYERHPVSHKAADEVNIAAEAVKLGDGDVALEFLRSSESSLELRATVESIRALASLDFYELQNQLQALSFRKLGKRLPLGLDAEPRASLLGR